MFHEWLDTADLCQNAEEKLEVYRENAFSDLLKHPGFPHVFASVREEMLNPFDFQAMHQLL